MKSLEILESNQCSFLIENGRDSSGNINEAKKWLQTEFRKRASEINLKVYASFGSNVLIYTTINLFLKLNPDKPPYQIKFFRDFDSSYKSGQKILSTIEKP